jgi:DNA polymerase III delta prime subunit
VKFFFAMLGSSAYHLRTLSDRSSALVPWRERAVQAALRASGEYSNPTDVLFSYVRQHLPGHCTGYDQGDAARLRAFVDQHFTDARSMLDTTHEGHNWLGECAESVLWFAAYFNGLRVELTTTPSANNPHGLFVIAHERATVTAVLDAWSKWNLRPAGRSLVHAHGWQQAPDIDAEIGRTTWEDIVLSPSLLEDLRRTIDGFVQHRAAFEALGFPWRRGVLLVGPPGTGKTLVCRAVAAQLKDYPFLYVRDLQGNGYGNNPISSIFDRARKLSPCVLAFEDIDSFISEGNRAVFLNELDGFSANTGLFVIASSNHPERIDVALLKRPSRFDRVFHLGLPAEPERAEFGRRLLQRSALSTRIEPSLDVDSLAKQLAKDSDGFTPAYLKEVYLAAALALAQRGVERLGAEYATECNEQLRVLREQMKKTRDASALGELDAQEIGFRR